MLILLSRDHIWGITVINYMIFRSLFKGSSKSSSSYRWHVFPKKGVGALLLILLISASNNTLKNGRH